MQLSSTLVAIRCKSLRNSPVRGNQRAKSSPEMNECRQMITTCITALLCYRNVSKDDSNSISFIHFFSYDLEAFSTGLLGYIDGCRLDGMVSYCYILFCIEKRFFSGTWNDRFSSVEKASFGRELPPRSSSCFISFLVDPFSRK